jgi:hypothetical protein
MDFEGEDFYTLDEDLLDVMEYEYLLLDTEQDIVDNEYNGGCQPYEENK